MSTKLGVTHIITYRFSTNDFVKYEIKFVSSSDYFEAYDELNADVFGMMISVAGLMSRLHPRRGQIVDMFMSMGEKEK